MRNGLIRAVAGLLAIGWLTAAFAQAPAAGAKDADLAKQQQARQQSQPGNNQPVWSEVRSGAPQFTSIPGRETNVLIQSQGQTWRAAHLQAATIGGVLISIVLLGLLGYYAWRGPIELHGKPTGRLIQRFTPAKRLAHWSMALSFVTLAITGLIITFGKSLLLPLIGYTLFSWLATVAKTIHNFLSPLFSVALLVFIVMFISDNIPRASDAKWLAKFGGMLDRSGQTHPPSGKFNAGEKALFWVLVCFLGVLLVLSGYVLLFPNFDQTRSTMQIANIVHIGAALLGTAMACFHIYLGTVGMRGAFDAMRYGYVDEAWAKEHHEYWYNDVVAGKLPRGPEPAAQLPRSRFAV